MKLIKQLSLFVENTPGSIAKVCNVLRENDLSIWYTEPGRYQRVRHPAPFDQRERRRRQGSC